MEEQLCDIRMALSTSPRIIKKKTSNNKPILTYQLTGIYEFYITTKLKQEYVLKSNRLLRDGNNTARINIR